MDMDAGMSARRAAEVELGDAILALREKRRRQTDSARR
jgi:hypothetical protein